MIVDLHVETTSALNIHEVGVRLGHKTLALVELSLVGGGGVHQVVINLNG